MNQRVFIAPSPIHGMGLFAAQPLRAGELVGIYQGPVVTTDGPHVLWIENAGGDGWTGYDGNNEMRFMNHADEPTAEMDGLYCYALRDLETGTEVTIDYGWNDS